MSLATFCSLFLSSSQSTFSVSTYRAVQTQCDQHEEEDDGEEGGCWHVGYGLRICDEEEAGA